MNKTIEALTRQQKAILLRPCSTQACRDRKVNDLMQLHVKIITELMKENNK